MHPPARCGCGVRSCADVLSITKLGQRRAAWGADREFSGSLWTREANPEPENGESDDLQECLRLLRELPGPAILRRNGPDDFYVYVVEFWIIDAAASSADRLVQLLPQVPGTKVVNNVRMGVRPARTELNPFRYALGAVVTARNPCSGSGAARTVGLSAF